MAWQVLDTPVEISQEQLDAFTAVVEGNFRPTQPLGDRELVRRRRRRVGGGLRLPVFSGGSSPVAFSQTFAAPRRERTRATPAAAPSPAAQAIARAVATDRSSSAGGISSPVAAVHAF